MLRRDKKHRFVYPDDAVMKSTYSWRSMLRLLQYILPYWKQLVPVAVMLLIGTLTKLAIPILIVAAIDHAINPVDGEGSSMLLLWYVGGMLLLYLIQKSAGRYRIRYMNRIGQRIISDLRLALFQRVQALQLRFYDRHTVGSVLGRITGDVNAMEELLTNGVVTMLMDSIQLIGIAVVLLIWNFKLGIAVMLVVPLMFMVSMVLRRKIRFSFQSLRFKQTRINAHLNESIQGIKVTQAYGQEQPNIHFFERINSEHIKEWDKASALNQLFGPMIELTSAVGTLILFWYGSFLIQSQAITVGVLIGFSNYIASFWEPVTRLGQLYTQLLVGMASAERIFEFMDEGSRHMELPNAKKLPEVIGEVTLEGVQFEYEQGRPALQDIHLNVRAGSTVALIGNTGAGKSTLVHLLGRYYEPSQGRILIDGIDIREVTLHSLRSQMGVVLQDTFIFAGTIRENIRYGRLNASDEEVEKAANMVFAHEFISELPQGYDTELQERGVSLSMGQRQLLAFARAVLADPRILILDEATANIDTEMEVKIRKALSQIQQDRTTFIIAHRLSTIRDADLIVVIDQGRIIEQGNHVELMKRQGVYRKLVEAQ
ncbi:ABC transporter ATP-binding protein [Paenibacillus lemnae]|uniref:ABC transporter ATP-binding protein n=1 Tax=Paenibacillus lemnae TaxID=1330551 RepID=A0A848MBZ4_PAELE|nr:ABC transporter ATP-binding protein [Paenibacillus lemnae]NMO98225.1 ABC transporter ATP-binding protein [Paenibacillus lemnae]